MCMLLQPKTPMPFWPSKKKTDHFFFELVANHKIMIDLN